MAMKLYCRQITGTAALAVLLIPTAMAATEELDIDIAEVPASDGRELSVSVSGSHVQLQALVGTSVSLIRYIDSATTPVTSGESRDLELINHHIVYEISRLGDVDAERALNVAAAAPILGEAVCDRADKVQFRPFTRLLSAPERRHIFQLVI